MGLLTLALMLAAQPPAARDLEVKRTTPPTRPAPQIPRSYAVIIGIGQYQNVKQNLLYSERDAESMFTILISLEGGNFPAQNVHRLIGPKATLANIRHELEEWLPSETKDDDRVLIYFAGHGFVKDGKGYLAPYDIRLDNIEATGYPMDRLGEVFGRRIEGKWKVLLTDACHSGAITPEASATLNHGFIELNKSVFVLSASRDREQSFESPDWGGGHGVFTYYVERGLSGSADENRDGIVTADELAEYVRTNVRRETNNQQTPNSERGSFDPQMLLAYVPENARIDPPAAPKYGTLVFETNMDGVEILLDGKSIGVVNKGKALRQQGLTPGAHTVQGVRMGYEPDGPREEMVYPGQETTVSIKIRFVRKRAQAAVDELNRGIRLYTEGKPENYRKSVDAFQKALQIDPAFSQAALYLGRAYNALNEQQTASKYFERAVEIDPDYLEARWSYAGNLLDTGATDEAIRQLNAVIQRDKQVGIAWYLLAEAYREKEAYPEAIDAAQNALRLIPGKAEAHFWLAEGLRMNGQLEQAEKSYVDYLRLSDFDSKLAGQLNYWVLGFLIGHGRKTHAGQRDIWNDLRSLAYFGLCDCSRQLGRYDEAIGYCQRAVAYDPKDPYIHYLLGLTYATKAQKTRNLESLASASKCFRSMLAINPDMTEAGDVRKMLDNFDRVLRQP